MLNMLLDKIMAVKGYHFKDGQDAKSICFRLIAEASREIYIVVGELDGTFYNDTFINLIKHKITDIPVKKVKILFHKEVEKASMIENMKQNNPSLLSLLENYNDLHILEIYWSEKRPKYHFCLVDNNVFIETEHKAHDSYEVYIKIDAQRLKDEYVEHFNNMINQDFVHKLSRVDFYTEYVLDSSLPMGSISWKRV